MKCEDNGHDSSTCNCCTSIRLFGVQIDVADGNLEKNGESLRKSKSLGNLEACNAENTRVEAGYLSDGFMHQSRSKEAHHRKRGRPWSEKEHRCFLVGLEKLGKGDWKGISKNYVPSRNSSQVASHAQKYFIRLLATEKRRRRSSVFDIPLTEKNASASLGSPSNKAFEISQHAISSGDASKNLGEFERQASMQPHVTSEKPPLSPMPKLHGINNFRRVAPYMAGVSYINQSFREHRKTPTVSWLSIVNYQNLIFATCSPFMRQPESSILGPIHQGASFRAGPSTGVAKNNALNLS